MVEPTRPTVVTIGERHRPEPNGRLGFLSIDTVDRGDFDDLKGVYHINAMDEVTQWQRMAATPKISELWLIPVLEAILEQFPFRIRGFHSDNGSEYINFNVARLLSKLLIGQTTSRSLHSNDNGLVDANHGAVIRKHLGYGFIDAPYSGQITGFHSERLNPYVKFHRSCAAHALRPVGKGKLKCVCRGWAAPYELLREVTKRPWPCKRPSGNCSGVSDARSHELVAAHGRELGLWKCRALEAEEKGSAVSPRSHRPWKSLRDSHIPTASTTTIHVHTQHKTRGRGKSSAAPDTLRTHLRKVAP